MTEIKYVGVYGKVGIYIYMNLYADDDIVYY